jgi:hypothetical protein
MQKIINNQIQISKYYTVKIKDGIFGLGLLGEGTEEVSGILYSGHPFLVLNIRQKGYSYDFKILFTIEGRIVSGWLMNYDYFHRADFFLLDESIQKQNVFYEDMMDKIQEMNKIQPLIKTNSEL